MSDPEFDFIPDDALFRIERRIAQRADELTGGRLVDREGALAYWQQAEIEIWASADTVKEARRLISRGEPTVAGLPGGPGGQESNVASL